MDKAENNAYKKEREGGKLKRREKGEQRKKGKKKMK